MKIMRFFIALSVLVCVAVATPPRRSCPGRGNPNGYHNGLCASEEPYCDEGFTCEDGVCCRSKDFNKPPVCPIGKPLGDGLCDNEGNCPGDLKCINDVCCKIPKVEECPSNPCDDFVCAEPKLVSGGPVCTFDTNTCTATVTVFGDDVTSLCLPDTVDLK